MCNIIFYVKIEHILIYHAIHQKYNRGPQFGNLCSIINTSCVYPYLWSSGSGSRGNWVGLRPSPSRRSPKTRTVGIPWAASLRSWCSYRRTPFPCPRPETEQEFTRNLYIYKAKMGGTRGPPEQEIKKYLYKYSSRIFIVVPGVETVTCWLHCHYTFQTPKSNKVNEEKKVS